MVSAASLRAKLAGLGVERQEVRVSGDGYFDDTMNYAEILSKVAAERGNRAAWHLAMAFELDPAEHGICFDGEPAATSPMPAPKQLGYSQFASEEAKPVSRKRELWPRLAYRLLSRSILSSDTAGISVT